MLTSAWSRRRGAPLVALAVAVAVMLTGLISNPADAAGYPSEEKDFVGLTDVFGPYFGAPYARSRTRVVWFNRSVKVSGNVSEAGDVPGSATVRFTFRHGNTVLARQTRTAKLQQTVGDSVKGYSFMQPGPRGGITRIDVELCDNGAGICKHVGEFRRPGW